MGERNSHRGPEAVSDAMGATFSDRPSAAGPRYVFSPAITSSEFLSADAENPTEVLSGIPAAAAIRRRLGKEPEFLDGLQEHG